MRTSSMFLRLAIASVAVGLIAPLATLGQTFAASTGTDAIVSTTPPSTSAGPKLTVPGHHRRAEESLIYGRVRDGVYTVDGMVAKVQLNYDVDGANFLYLFVPGVGTAVVSATPAPDSVTDQARYQDNELSFAVGEHRFKLTGVALANSKGAAPEHLFVRLDRSAWRLNRQPMVGFGNVGEPPYAWPGALPPATAANRPEELRVAAPPVPSSLLPSTIALQPSVVPPVAVSPAALQPVALR